MARSCAAFACVVCVLLLGDVQQVRAASLTVAWDRSPDSTVAGYLVSYGTETRKYSKSIVAGNSTSITLTGLGDATIYYVVVQSYNSQGILGEPSSEAVGQTPLTAPSISCPAPVLTSPDGKSISVTLLPVVSGGAQPVTTRCSPESGSLFPVGSTSFSCTAVDAIQRTASCASTVVVLAPSSPTPPPTSPTPSPTPPALTIACPVIQPVTANGNSGKAVVKFADPVVSGGKAPVTANCTPRSGSQFATGTTTVSCHATDALQQVAACTTSATVLATPSPTPPAEQTPALTITCPVIPPVTATGNSGKAVVKFDDPVVSGGKAPVTASCTPRSGSQFAIGTATVSCRATDALQQVAACTTSATVLAPK